MADIGITFTLQVQFNIIKKVKNFVRITLREIKELIVTDKTIKDTRRKNYEPAKDSGRR